MKYKKEKLGTHVTVTIKNPGGNPDRIRECWEDYNDPGQIKFRQKMGIRKLEKMGL